MVYRVAAINALNTGPYSAASTGVPLPRAGVEPSAPTGLKAVVSPTTAGTVNLSWNAPRRAGSETTAYSVQWSVDGNQPWVATGITLATPATDTTATNLSVPAGTTRYYRVAATNSEGTGPYTTAEAKVTTRPAGVPGVPRWQATEADSAQAVGLTAVELSWREPDPAPNVPISGYVIERSTDGGTTWVVAIASTGNNDMLYYRDTHGSLAGKTVNYRVAAINDLGTGVFTAQLTDGIRLPTRGREPGAPMGLTARAVDADTISVSWTAPAKANSDEADVSGFSIQWSAKGEQPWVDTTNQSSDADTTTITDDVAAAGQKRYYRVAATNSDGTGPYTTAKVSATAGVPAAPTAGPTAVAVGLTTVELTWVPPADTTVTGYKIQRSTSTPVKWVDVTANTGNNKAYYSDTHSSLAGKSVVYRVASIGVHGTSSSFSPATDPAVALPVAGNQPGAPTGLKAEVSPTDFGMIKLSWDTPPRGDSATTGYIVQHSTKGEQPWMDIDPVHSGTDTIATDGTEAAPVPPGTTRYYRVAAMKTGDEGRGPYSAKVSVTTPRAGLPAAPAAAPTAVAVGLQTVELTWTMSSDTTVTGYKIERSTDSGKNWVVAKANTGDKKLHYSDTDSSLAGKKAVYRVAAINSLGTGPVSASSESVTLPKTGTQPGAPTGLTVVATSLTTATISWTAPPKGKSDIVGYTIQWSAKGEQPWANVPDTAGADGHAVTHTGTATTATVVATNGVTHHYRVAASNGETPAMGPFSDSATAGDAADQPGMVTLSSQEPMVGRAITASLTDPDGGESGQQWQWEKSMDKTSWEDATGTGATTMSYTPVAADADYYLRATVAYSDSNRSGRKAYSEATTGMVTADPVLTKHDANGNGMIDLSEAVEVLRKFLANDPDVPLSEAVAVLRLFLGNG